MANNGNWHVAKQIQLNDQPVINEVQFWHAIDIWWQQPHCINQRLCGAQILNSESIDHQTFEQSNKIIFNNTFDVVWHRRLLVPKSSRHFYAVNELFGKLPACAAYFIPQLLKIDDNKLKNPHVSIPYKISLKYNYENEIQILLLEVYVDDKSSTSATVDVDLDSKEIRWLQNILFPSILKWAQQADASIAVKQSLRQLDLQTYNNVYTQLKKKYADWLVRNWTERTDPKKFVYEDIAIAAYLLTLWGQRSTEKQSYVDIGCGNGLLVYILNSEGHRGVGIDLRRRGCWDFLSDKATLVERPFYPDQLEDLFPEADWLIGNHSDELTPWIPIIATRSSSKCQYFVLPCCPFDLFGKYQRQQTDLSPYRCNLHYVKKIGQLCEFDVFEDRLKIPSTKRICFVGLRNNNVGITPENYESLKFKITELIESKRSSSSNHSFLANSQHQHHFIVRDKVEPVRNCTQLPKNDIDKFIKIITDKLLQEDRWVSTSSSAAGDSNLWNRGGMLSIGDCANLFNREEKQILKSQCGGLKTLLRNHKYVFKIENDAVCLNYWTVEKCEAKRLKLGKLRKCWFYFNHPQRCPLTEDECCYSHTANTLQ